MKFQPQEAVTKKVMLNCESVLPNMFLHPITSGNKWQYISWAKSVEWVTQNACRCGTEQERLK